jgi:hypothetical protein
MSQNKKKYTTLGTMMVAKKRDPNDENEAKRFYVKLEQQTKSDGTPYGETVFPITLANGKKLNSGDIISMQNKKEKFQRAVEAGRMDADKAAQLASFLLFDLVVVEDDNGSSDSGSDNINF